MLQKRIHTFRKNKIEVNNPILWKFTKKEIIWMLIFIIIGSFISFVPIIPNDDPIKILTTILAFSLIIVVPIAVKKISANFYSIKIEHYDWKLIRFWWYKRSYLKNPLPTGLIIPFFLAIFTLGFLKPFAFFQFDAVGILEKRKEYINEEDLGYTAASGMYALLILAAIGAILTPHFPLFGSTLSKYSIFYGLWNMIPASQLDGSKIFFGTTLLWTFLLLIFAISSIFIFI